MPQLGHRFPDGLSPHPPLQPDHKTGLVIKVQLKAVSYIQGLNRFSIGRKWGVGEKQSTGTLLSECEFQNS